jgi:hypothetical protein
MGDMSCYEAPEGAASYQCGEVGSEGRHFFHVGWVAEMARRIVLPDRFLYDQCQMWIEPV